MTYKKPTTATNTGFFDHTGPQYKYITYQGTHSTLFVATCQHKWRPLGTTWHHLELGTTWTTLRHHLGQLGDHLAQFENCMDNTGASIMKSMDTTWNNTEATWRQLWVCFWHINETTLRHRWYKFEKDLETTLVEIWHNFETTYGLHGDY